MKKIVSFIIVIGCIVSLTGCASMLKSMGGVSKSELAAYTTSTDEKLNSMSAALTNAENAMKEIESIKTLVAQLSADLEAAKLSTSELEADLESAQLSVSELEVALATLDELKSKVNNLSDDTLLKLSQLIQDALAANTAVAIEQK